jgi:hypothetical protein
MSHFHFCDYAGHEWKCEGTALRPLVGGTVRSVCMCLRHNVPLADGEHSNCPVELLACPEHREEQLRDMGTLNASDLPGGQVDTGSAMFKDNDCNPTVSFCLWRNKDFYSMEEVEAHNADESRACPTFKERKGKGCGTPAL